MRACAIALSTAGCCIAPAALAAPPPVETYGELPLFESPQMSPDGKMVAFISTAKGRRCVFVHYLDSDKPPQANCPAGLEVKWFHWKTSSRLLIGVYQTVKVNGVSTFTVSYLMATDVDGGHTIQLSSMKQGRYFNFATDAVSDFLYDDPNHIEMPMYLHSGDYPDLVAIDVHTGEVLTVAESRDHIASWLTDTHGVPRVGYSVKGDTHAILYRSTGTADFVKLEGDDLVGTTDFTPLDFSDTPGLIYVASKKETGWRCIYLYDAEAKRVADRYACRDDSDIMSLISKGDRVIGYTYADDQLHQVFVDPAWARDWASVARKFPNGNVFLYDRSDDNRRALFGVVEGYRPEELYVLTRTPGLPTKLDPIASEYPSIPDEAVAPVKSVTYRARDGLQIHAYLTMPLGVGAGPVPFVVLPHGGPYSRDYLEFDYLSQMIASRGYGVLQPNFRGSTGYGRAFLEAGFREWGRKMQDDVTDATKWLIDQKLADPSRICIVGWSYGGYAALMGAIREPNLYRCAASMAGVTDLTHLQPGTGYRLSEEAVPHLDGERALIRENSPVKNADKITVPILLAHGRQDINVAFADSVDMEQALKDAGKKVDSIYFDNDDHFLFIENDRIAFLKKLESFLRENLGPSPVH